jgi:acetate kinase
MNVLVLSCGSSSVRFQVIETGPAAIERDDDRRGRASCPRTWKARR